MKFLEWILLLLFFFSTATHGAFARSRGGTDGPSSTNINWLEKGQQDLLEAVKAEYNWKSAKNTILFVGDGMGFSTQTATRFLKAQNTGAKIPDTKLSWESFRTTGIIKTYNTDLQTPDSAGTANAFLCGEKSRGEVVGVNQNVLKGKCSDVVGNEATSLLHYAMDEGKWTGIVTTTRITHATPASAYAHSASREWESDADMPEDTEDCVDIANQLIKGPKNNNIRVILGGGRIKLIPNTMTDPEYPDKNGTRLDGLDLRQEWLDIHKNKALTDAQYKYVENLTDFESIDPSQVEYLMGLFEPSHMQYESDRLNDKWGEPSLAQMVDKSIDILKKAEDGFFLLVEGGRIDHAHHDNNAYRALYDTLALDDAVQIAIDKTREEDTLIVLTADHSHVFTMAGYPFIDNDIFGVVVDVLDTVKLADDGKPRLTLSYADGPGFDIHKPLNISTDQRSSRLDLTHVITNGSDFIQDANVPLSAGETHGGEDIAVYATGPMSHLFTGIHEQSYIAHAIGYAACMGWNKEMCQNPRSQPGCPADETAGVQSVNSNTSLTYVLIAISIIIGLLQKNI